MRDHRPRRTLGSVSLVTAFVAIMLAVPVGALAADFVVNSIPGEGWVQSIDNTAGLAAEIVEGPAGGLGLGSVQLTTDASTDHVGIARPLLGDLADLVGGSWMTNITGDTVTPNSEPASLRFTMYRLGGLSEFTTMVVERVYNDVTSTPGAWETTTLDDETVVWQTNTAGGFCSAFPFCTFAEFKAQYPNANLLGLTVAYGTGLPPTTSWVDGVSLTTTDGETETTDTWDFEPVVAATPTPTLPPTVTPPPSGSEAPIVGGPTTPPTSTLEPNESSSLSGMLAVIAVVSLASLIALVPARRARLARPIRERRDPPRR